MWSIDIESVERLLRRNVGIVNPAMIIAPSGDGSENQVCKDLYGVGTRDISQAEWDLDQPPTSDIRGDLAIACNTFLCSTDPDRWLRNIAQAAPFLVIQDLAEARRGPGKHVDPGSGDVQRYSISSHGVLGKTDPEAAPVFDLSTCGARVIDVEAYGSEHGFVKFAVLLDLRPLRQPVPEGTWGAVGAAVIWLGSTFIEAADLLELLPI